MCACVKPLFQTPRRNLHTEKKSGECCQDQRHAKVGCKASAAARSGGGKELCKFQLNVTNTSWLGQSVSVCILATKVCVSQPQVSLVTRMRTMTCRRSCLLWQCIPSSSYFFKIQTPGLCDDIIMWRHFFKFIETSPEVKFMEVRGGADNERLSWPCDCAPMMGE